jgi:DNA-binding beta-propeller fold protein YncE
MKKMLVIAGLVTVSICMGRWTGTLIPLPDSLGGLAEPELVAFGQSGAKAYVTGWGDGAIVVFDVAQDRRIARIETGLAEVSDMCCVEAHNTLCVAGERLDFVDELQLVDCASDSVVAVLGPKAKGLAYSTSMDKLYCLTRGYVHVVDVGERRVLDSIPVSGTPESICYNPVEDRVYFTTEYPRWLRVIDCATDSIVDWVRVRSQWNQLLFSARQNKLYVAHDYRPEPLYVIDGTTNEILDSTRVLISTGSREQCWDPVYDRLYYSDVGYWPGPDTAVTVVDCAGDSVLAVVNVGTNVLAFGCSPDGKKLYVFGYSNSSGSRIVVVDAEGLVVVDTVARAYAADIGFSPDGSRAYAAGSSTGDVLILDAEADSVARVVEVGAWPEVLCHNPGTGKLYCAAADPWDDSQLLVLDGPGRRVVRQLEMPGRVGSMECAGSVNKIYCTVAYSDTMLVVDGNADTVLTRIPTRSEPSAMVFNSDASKLYCAGDGDDEGVVVIDVFEDTALTLIDLDIVKPSLTWNPKTNKVYCGSGFDYMYAIDCSADTLKATIDLLWGYSLEVCCDPVYNKLYCGGAYEYSDIAVIDGAGDSLLGFVPRCHGSIVGIYCDTVEHKVYCLFRYRLAVIDVVTDTVVASIDLNDEEAKAVTGSPEMGVVFCTAGEYEEYGGYVYAVDVPADSVLAVIPVGRYPTDLAWDQAQQWLYVANHTGATISVVFDSAAAVSERSSPARIEHPCVATVARGVLRLPRDKTDFRSGKLDRGPSHALLDITGRKVMPLQPGPNDIRHLAPGVYFVRSAGSGRRDAVRKVIVER